MDGGDDGRAGIQSLGDGRRVLFPAELVADDEIG